MSTNNSYTSGGATPVIIGAAALVLGSVSILTSFSQSASAIIQTGLGNGADAIVSVLVAASGLLIWKNKNTMAAIFFAGLVISLIVYGQYKVDTKRAVNVMGAAASAAATAASAATTAATSEYNSSYPQRGKTESYPEYQANGAWEEKPWRKLGRLEAKQCRDGNHAWTKTEAGKYYCDLGECPIEKCGTEGK